MFWRRGAGIISILAVSLGLGGAWVHAEGPMTFELLRRVLLLERLRDRYQIPISPAEAEDMARVRAWRAQNERLLREGPLPADRQELVSEVRAWEASGRFAPSEAEVFWNGPRIVPISRLNRHGPVDAAKILGVDPASLGQAIGSLVLLQSEIGSGNAVQVGPGLFLTNAHVVLNLKGETTVVRFRAGQAPQKQKGSCEVRFSDTLHDIALIKVALPQGHPFMDAPSVNISLSPMGGKKAISVTLLPTVKGETLGWVPVIATDRLEQKEWLYESHIFVNAGSSGSPVFVVGEDGTLTLQGIVASSGNRALNNSRFPNELFSDPVRLGLELSTHQSIVTGFNGLAESHRFNADSLRGVDLPGGETILSHEWSEWLRVSAKMQTAENKPVAVLWSLLAFFSRLPHHERLLLLGRLLGEGTVEGRVLALDAIQRFEPIWIFRNRKFLADRFGWPDRDLLAYFEGVRRAIEDAGGVIPELSDHQVPGKITVDFNGLNRDELVRGFVAHVRAMRGCGVHLEGSGPEGAGS